MMSCYLLVFDLSITCPYSHITHTNLATHINKMFIASYTSIKICVNQNEHPLYGTKCQFDVRDDRMSYFVQLCTTVVI